MYELTSYDWTHASTGRNLSGVSFDTNYPFIPYSMIGNPLILTLECWLEIHPNPVNGTVQNVSRTISSYTFIQFEVSAPPNISNLQANFTPSEGLALNTTFRMSCSGGITDKLPLTYSLGFVATDVDITAFNSNPIVGATLAINCTWLLLNCAFFAIYCIKIDLHLHYLFSYYQ